MKEEFGLTKGLADTSKVKIKRKIHGTAKTRKGQKGKDVHEEVEVHKVQILDPATGTGTFLAETIKQIYSKFKGQEGLWSSYVENDLIPRINGFEILMASYTMCHLKIEMLLKESGYKPKNTQNQPRLKVFLTNSLEEAHPDTGTLFASWLAKEASAANSVKEDTPVMCVIGNPPYSGESQNKGQWIMNLMDDYKKEPGGKEKLKERNPKWINDDYVKFIRYSQYFIEKNGEGILAFINPHGFLDNPTFRGMRWHLQKTYDKIFTIDLHGNSKKKEIAPNGSKDENVFDIQQGVSINIFIKTSNKKPNELGKVFHHDLYGKRESKYTFLNNNSLKTISFKELPNKAPMYFMVYKDFKIENEYNKGFSIKEIFPLNSVGIVTARDNFTIHTKKKDLTKTIEKFLSLDDEEARKIFKLGKDVRDWKVIYAKNDLLKNYPSKGKFTKINYRPFDDKWTFYTGASKGFHCYPRAEIMNNFIEIENIGLVYKLGNPEEKSVSVMISKNIIDFRSWSRPGMQGGDYISPLYLTPDTKSFDRKKRVNINQNILNILLNKLQLNYSSEDNKGSNEITPIIIVDYIYAILHSPSYRKKYNEFLKIDFPRIPYPEDKEVFWKLVKLGGELRTIHLLENPIIEEYITSYPIDGSNVVEKTQYKDGKVFINKEQYFDGVPEVAWNFYIGGYQPAQKWLKDRKGRELSVDDILHYQKIIVALTETDRIMKEIDKVVSF